MDRWANVDPLSLPLGATREDIEVGQTELGQPVYQTRTGQKYAINYQPVQGGSRVKPMLNALAADPWGVARGVGGAIVSSTWDAITAPGRAAAGHSPAPKPP